MFADVQFQWIRLLMFSGTGQYPSLRVSPSQISGKKVVGFLLVVRFGILSSNEASPIMECHMCPSGIKEEHLCSLWMRPYGGGLNWAWGLVSCSTECQGLLSNKDHETGPLAKSVDLVRHASCLTPSIKDYNYTCSQISLFLGPADRKDEITIAMHPSTSSFKALPERTRNLPD